LLIDLIEHFSQYNLANSNVDPDILGQAYEYLIKAFADLTNKKGGEFYTPRSVVHLMGLIVDAKPGESIYDPACGTGGMLLESINHVKELGQDYRTLKLYGQEKNLTSSSIARMNMFLHGIEDFQIVREDTLRHPAFFEGDELKTFEWGAENWAADPYGRNIAGVPPQGNGDMAWVQHMIKSMNAKTGRMAIVLPNGALFRKGAEGKIRKALLDMDLLEAVVGLGSNIFYGTQLSPSILIFKAKKEASKRGRVIFIDAADQVRVGRAQNFLEKPHVEQIYNWYSNNNNVTDYVKVVTIDAIAENDYNLNIPLYIDKTVEDNLPTVEQAVVNLKAAWNEVQLAEEKFKNILSRFI
jgi:type I restriction enzyme M protein